MCSQKQWWVRITVSTRDSQSRNRSSILLPTTRRRGRLKKVGLFFVKFEVPQRQQIASGKRRIFGGAPYQKRLPLTRTPLTLSALAPSIISFVPLTRNLSLAAPSPCSEGGQAFQRQQPPAFQRWSSLFWQFEEFGAGKVFLLFADVAFGTGEGLLVHGMDARYRRGAPGVRDVFS